MESVVSEQHYRTHNIFHSIKPLYTHWGWRQAIYCALWSRVAYDSILQRTGQVLWKGSGWAQKLLRNRQVIRGGSGSESACE